MNACTNPKVVPDTQLLLTAYECKDRYYDLYFNIGDDGEVELWDAALTGETTSAGILLFNPADIAAIEHAAQGKYDADVREANFDARIWAKAMDKNEVFA